MEARQCRAELSAMHGVRAKEDRLQASSQRCPLSLKVLISLVAGFIMGLSEFEIIIEGELVRKVKFNIKNRASHRPSHSNSANLFLFFIIYSR